MQGGGFVAEEVDVGGEHDGAVGVAVQAGEVCDWCCMV